MELKDDTAPQGVEEASTDGAVDKKEGINTPPIAANNRLKLSPDGDYEFSTEDFGYQDAEGDPLHHLTIESLPTQGELVSTYSIDIKAGQQIPSDQIEGMVYGSLSKPGSESEPDHITFKVNDGSLDSEEVYTLTLSEPVPTKITLSEKSLPESTDTQSGPVEIAKIQLQSDSIETPIYSVSGKDADKLEAKGGSLFLKQGQQLNYEQSKALKFKLTAVEASDSSISYTTPSPFVVKVDFSYSAERPYAIAGVIDGGYSGSSIFSSGRQDDFAVNFKTLSNAELVQWRVYSYGPHSQSYMEKESNALSVALSNSDENGNAFFALDYFEPELANNLYTTHLLVQDNDGQSHIGHPISLGVGIPSHSYPFTSMVEGGFTSSTFPFRATTSGNVSLTNGYSGKGLKLSGGSLSIDELPSALAKDFTVCYQVLISQVTVEGQALAKAQFGSDTFELGLFDKSGYTGMRYGDTTLTAPVQLTDGQFHHVCLVRSYDLGNPEENISKSSQLEVHVDGKSVSKVLVHENPEQAELPSKIEQLGSTSDDIIIDNLHVYPFVLDESEVSGDYTVDAHVHWQCESAQECPAPEQLDLGLMLTELQINGLGSGSSFQLEFQPKPGFTIAEGYKFHCSMDGVNLGSQDGRLFTIAPAQGSIKTLQCGPENPGISPYEKPNTQSFLISFDSADKHLNGAPALKLWVDNSSFQDGGQVSLHTQGSSSGIIHQQDIVFADKSTLHLSNINSEEGDTVVLPLGEVLDSPSEEGLKSLSKVDSSTEGLTKVSISDWTINSLSPHSLIIHSDDLSVDVLS